MTEVTLHAHMQRGSSQKLNSLSILESPLSAGFLSDRVALCSTWAGVGLGSSCENSPSEVVAAAFSGHLLFFFQPRPSLGHIPPTADHTCPSVSVSLF